MALFQYPPTINISRIYQQIAEYINKIINNFGGIKMQKKLLLVVTALGAMTLAACDQGKTSGIVADPLNATMIADFSKGKSEEVYASDGWSNGQPFNAVWTNDNITYSDGKMKLSIQDKEAEADGVTYPHTAGEARTHKLYGYGDYEVRMKPTNVVGSVSTFFTYTDKWNKVNGVENKHDEIDIEFLGKDTTKVQFNYFVGGQGGHEHMHDLGFDASQGFHNYGFRWAEKSITWFVDGQPVYQVNKDNPAELPSQNGRMMASYWPSSLASWSGTYEGPSDKTCEYEWIKSSGNTIYADGEAPIPPFDNKINWDSISKTDLEFGADPTDTGYTVTKADGVTTIAYDQPKAWKNAQAEAVDVVNSNDAVSLVLKNNSATESTIRVDVQGENKVGNRDALNEMAIAYGTDAEVTTDLDWGGSKLTLAAGEEARLVVKYDVTTNRGLAKNILIFADSLSEAPAAHQGGNITVKDIKFGSTTGTPIVPPTPEPTPTEDPWEDIDPVDVTFTGGADYTITKSEGVTNVTYTQASNWENLSADIRSLANGENDAAGVKFKNNGTTNVAVRVDIQGVTKVGNTDCLNTSASASDGRNVSTDTEWGGSSFTLKAGEEVVITINYATDTDKGAAKNLLIFLDSLQGTPKVNNGNVSISEVKFGNFDDEVPATPTPAPVDPEPTPTPEPGDEPYDDTVVVPAISENAVALSFWSSDATSYPAVSGDSGKSVSVTYSDIAASAYKCIGAESLAGITDLASVNQVKVTVTNKGLKSANIRIDTKSAAGAHLQSGAAIAGEEGDYSGLDFSSEGTKFVVAAKKSVVVTIDLSGAATLGEYIFFLDSIGADATSGKIVLSSFEFAASGEPTPEPGPEPTPVDPEPTPVDPDPTPVDPDPTPVDPDPTPVDPVVVPDLDEDAAALTFWKSTEDYTIASSESNKILSVSYSELVGNSYGCVGANDLSGVVSATTDTVSVNITNKGTADAKVRIDTHHKTSDTTSNPLHVSASATGDIVGTVDYSGEGVILTVKANSNANLVITIDQSSELFDKLVIFVDSCNATADKKSGEVVFSSFVFSGEATPTPEPGPTPTPTPTPVEDLQLTFTGGEGYADLVTGTPVKSLTVSYTDLPGNGYANFETDVSAVTGLADNNIFKFQIVNNGANMAKIRIDTLSGTAHIHTNILTANDWGAWIQGEGSVVQVGNGQTVQVGITFDQAAGEKPLTRLVFFVDSCNDAAGNKTGEVVLSDFEFDTVYDWTKVSKTDATFTTDDTSIYSIEKEDGVSTITYTGAKDWANLNTYLAGVEGDYNAVQLRFRNKTNTTASIRIDLKDPSWSATNLTVVAEVFGRPEIQANANGETTITLYDSQMMDITFHYTDDLGFVLLFVDSMQSEAHSGQIAIESVKLGNIA